MSFENALKTIDLTNTQKTIIKERYINLINENRHRTRMLSTFFHIARLSVTVGSILVPALLSILSQHPILYWLAWSLSLIVTISHGLISIFKIDKKYYLVHTVNEQLQSEGWQFLELSSKYSGYNTPTEPPTHQNQFPFFCAAIEKIRIKQIQEEYWKMKDKDHKDTIKTEEFMPPSPYKMTAESQAITKKLVSYLSSANIVSQNENTKNKAVIKEEEKPALTKQSGEGTRSRTTSSNSYLETLQERSSSDEETPSEKNRETKPMSVLSIV